MKIIKDQFNNLKNLKGIHPSVVTIGTFDGLHLGHWKLLERAQKISLERNLDFIVISFDQSFKAKNNNINDQIISEEEKLDLLEGYFAIDLYIELIVDNELKKVSKDEFLDWLKNTLKCQVICEGDDFTFGSDKLGTVKDLENFFGKENTKILRRRSNGVSSSKIRRLISEGQIEKVNKLLFKPFKIYFDANKDSIKKIIFPKIEIDEGYYDVLLNDKYSATILITNNTASIVKINQPINEDISEASLLKNLGKTLN